MISPVGTIIADFDAKLTGSLDAMLALSVSTVQGPALAASALWFMGRAVQTTKREQWSPVWDTARFIALLMFTVRLDLLTAWLRDVVFLGLPARFMLAFTGAQGGVAIDGASAAGAAVNVLWAQVNIITAQAQAQAGILSMDVGLAASIASFVSYGLIVLMGLTYVVVRWLFGIAIILAPFVFALEPFGWFRGVLGRWVSKVAALIFLMIGGIILLQMVLHMEDGYLQRIIETQRTYEAATNALPWFDVPGRIAAVNAAMAATISNLGSMVACLFAGAMVLYGLPALVYSLFPGMAPHATPSPFALLLATRELTRAVQTLRIGGSPPGFSAGGGSGPNYGLTVAPQAPQVAHAAAPRQAALPPPPPPAMHTRSRP